MHLNGENCLNIILRAKLAGKGQIDRISLFMKETKQLSSWGCLPLPWGYIHAQDKKNLNIICFETSWPIKAKLYVENRSEGAMKVYINGQSHMTKMAAMAFNRIKTF